MLCIELRKPGRESVGRNTHERKIPMGTGENADVLGHKILKDLFMCPVQQLTDFMIRSGVDGFYQSLPLIRCTYGVR